MSSPAIVTPGLSGPVGQNDGVTHGTLDESRRVEFLAAAAEVIGTRGYAATRLADVASRLGVSAPLIVHYFGTRERLLTEALRYTEDCFYEVVGARLAGIASPAARLAELIDVCCSLEPTVDLPQGWALWFEIWIRAAHDPEAARNRAELDERWTALVASIIREGQQAGEFDAAIDADRVARMLAALLDGLSVQIRLGDPVVTPDYALSLALELRDRMLGRTAPAALA